MNPIPVQELRIGNIVMNIENGVSRVICCDMINLRQNYFPADPEGYWTSERRENILMDLGYNEAIPLTEEWLVKFGFTCYALGDGFIWTKGYMLSGYFDEIVGFSPIDHSLRRKLPVSSVHKLQNLFYVLSGEELTINESNG